LIEDWTSVFGLWS